MPLYEYRCRKCGRTIERIQKFSDNPLTKCESCRGALEKLISSPAIQFKGSGWYITDYAKKSSAAGGNGSPSTGTGSKVEPAAPATPAPAKPAATPK